MPKLKIHPEKQEAIDMMKKGDYDSSIRIAKEIINDNPSSPEGWEILVKSYFEMKETEKAKENCIEWILLFPHDAQAVIMFSKCQFLLDEITEALETANKAVVMDPKNTEVWNHLAIIYERMGCIGEASGALLVSLLINPNQDEPMRMLYDLYDHFVSSGPRYISRNIQKVYLAPPKSQSVTQIDLSGSEITSIDLEGLKFFPNLEILNLSDNQIENIELYPLVYCSNLKSLNLSNNRLTQLDIQILNNLSNLEHVDLSSNKLTHLDLVPLSLCLNLQELNLNSNEFTNLDLSPLSKCVNLRSIHIEGFELE